MSSTNNIYSILTEALAREITRRIKAENNIARLERQMEELLPLYAEEAESSECACDCKRSNSPRCGIELPEVLVPVFLPLHAARELLDDNAFLGCD